jgi:hypothetical protein
MSTAEWDPLDVYPGFSDFNLSAVRDPTFQSHVDRQKLFWLVYRSRQGDKRALDLLADTFRWTLSNRAAEIFEREHAHRPVPHREWVYDKLFQLTDILLYDGISAQRWDGKSVRHCSIENPEEDCTCFRSNGPSLDPQAIEATFRPEDIEQINFHELMRIVCLAPNPGEGLSRLVAWMKAHRKAWRLATLPESGWGKNGERDKAILNGLEREIERGRICADLDRSGISVNLPALTSRGFQTWREAWADPDGRMAIQRLFSKLAPRLEPVKSFILSE